MKNSMPRLPCRGCLTCCKDYAVCQGAPWRLPVEASEPDGVNKVKDKIQRKEK